MVHNGERFLTETIASVLRQTFGDFEYLLVDNASTDDSSAILEEFARQDRRIRVFRNPVNLNMSGSLNRALDLARGIYLANLDQDDLAHPERLERQVAFLDAHPEIGVVGAQAITIDALGKTLQPLTYPADPGLSRWIVLFGTPILHSAALMRRALVLQAGGYSVSQWLANDYILMANLIRLTGIVNLQDTLVSYRRHGGQTANVFTTAQQGQVLLLIHAMLVERLSLLIPLNEIGALFGALRGNVLDEAPTLLRIANRIGEIRQRYLAVERPESSVAAQIDTDCAKRLLRMAWTHRRIYRAASREVLRQATCLDPGILGRSGRAGLASSSRRRAPLTE